METNTQKRAPIVDSAEIQAQEHPRFQGIWVKGLLMATANPFASVNIVQVPPGGVIGHHIHPQQVETIFVIRGASSLFFDGTEFSFRSGQIVAIPIGVEHGLRNTGTEQVELLTFFTPPLVLQASQNT